MSNSETRYEKSGKLKPCCLDKNDLLKLEELIRKSFTTPEVDRYYRVSTNIGDTRVFYNSLEELLNKNETPDKIHELSFWIEGWDLETRLDKNILLDFSKFAIQLSVAGKDPVWVYDCYSEITNFLKEKTAWYWPIVTLERFIIFITTIILFTNMISSLSTSESAFYLDKAILIGLWIFLVFYDTRKLWPYLSINLGGEKTIFSKENVASVMLILLLFACFLVGTILPLVRKVWR